MIVLSDRINSFLTGVYCFDDGYVGKQPVAWKVYCAEYWLKNIQESMDRCTGIHDITGILLKKAQHPYNQSINQSITQPNQSVYLSVCFTIFDVVIFPLRMDYST